MTLSRQPTCTFFGGVGGHFGGRYQDFWKMCFCYLWVSVKDLDSMFALKVCYPRRRRLS